MPTQHSAHEAAAKPARNTGNNDLAREQGQTPPETGGWKPLDRDEGFEALVGPLFVTRDGLEQDEPLRLGFRVETRHCNMLMTCHGGMISTFMDQALGMSIYAGTGVSGPTMTLSIDYLSGAQLGDWIESRTRLIHSTYRTGYCDAIAYGANGVVARANGIWRLNRPKQS